MTKDKAIVDVVREKYGAVARSSLSGSEAAVRAVAEAFGYSATELESVPDGAHMGLSCGNPTAMASLRPGETVVDLGSGGGLDVFLASKQVGPTGRAIGIDMTPEMLARARKNAADGGYTNVDFHQASIDRMPLPDGSVDCIISNCVVNLAPDKDAVFRERYRVLRDGGRVALSDIALKQPLPRELRESVMSYVGCIAGAIAIDAYRSGLEAAGFSSVHVVDSGADLQAYAQIDGGAGCCSSSMQTGATSASCCAPSTPSCCEDASSSEVHAELSEILRRHDINAYAASVKVYAVKSRKG